MTHQQALDTMAAERYLLDEMTEVEKHAFEDHFFDCGDCADEVRRGDLIRQEVRRAGPQPAVQAPRHPGLSPVTPSRAAWRRPSVVLPWAVAATLALTTGYQALVTVPGLRQATSPQSLSPVMLRGATRGAVPMVTVSEGQRFITLGVDVTAPSIPEMSYDLLDAAGDTILSGRTPLPPAGAPLFLLLPAVELGEGRHTLIVRDPNSSGAPLGEYAFDISK